MTSKSVRICRSESHLGGIIRFLKKKKIASKKEIFLSTKNENHSSTVGVHLLNKLLTHNNKPTTTYWIFHYNAQQLLISISYHLPTSQGSNEVTIREQILFYIRTSFLSWFCWCWGDPTYFCSKGKTLIFCEWQNKVSSLAKYQIVICRALDTLDKI